jgi:hypothetical protein
MPDLTIDDVVLLDDGSLDTVIGVWCEVHQTHHEWRFSQEYAADYRDAMGALDLPRFFEDAVLPAWLSDPSCEEEP